MIVGQSAKRRLVIDPEHSVGSVKRFMGSHEKRYKIFGVEYTPVEISSFILKEIVHQAQKVLKENIEDVIITVPAYFNNNQKSDTLKAGKLAGLNVLQLLPEPTAAAIAYGLDKGRNQTIMVYDLGGGTFDVSILKITGNKFEVIAVGGDDKLGGDDFDNAIVEFLIKQFSKKTGYDFSDDKSKKVTLVRQKLKEAAEKAKIELSQAKSTEILIPEILGRKIEENLTLQTYNELIKPYLEKTVNILHSVLKEAKLSACDIDRVILVGGSTRNLAVKEIIAAEIKDPYISEQVDEEVSHGASIMGASMILPEEDFTPIDVTNITAHSLGLRVSQKSNQDHFKVLIKRQTPIPVKVDEKFTTFRDKQRSVEVLVFQGEADKCAQNVFVGGFLLEGIPAEPAGLPAIRVEFGMDSSDILRVQANCADISGQIELKINEIGQSDWRSRVTECIILLIDLSYSMDGWKLTTTKEAVAEFIKIKSSSDEKCDLIGCVSFDSFARTVVKPTCHLDDIVRHVEKFTPEGTTNMSNAFEEALTCFRDRKFAEMKKRIILLSDGEPDSTSEVRQILKTVVEMKVCVDTVGAGTDYNRDLLQEIAEKTGGQFKPAEDIQGLISAFTNLAESVTI